MLLPKLGISICEELETSPALGCTELFYFFHLRVEVRDSYDCVPSLGALLILLFHTSKARLRGRGVILRFNTGCICRSHSALNIRYTRQLILLLLPVVRLVTLYDRLFCDLAKDVAIRVKVLFLHFLLLFLLKMIEVKFMMICLQSLWNRLGWLFQRCVEREKTNTFRTCPRWSRFLASRCLRLKG